MADGDNQQPQPGVIDPRMIDQIMSALTPQQPTPQAQPVDMSQLPVTSLLGLAVGGGPQTGMSQQDATAAGNRALLNFGVNMLAASGYSPIRRTFGETFAQGVKGAEESLASSQAVSAAQKEAQQQYTQQQIANRAEALKTGMSMQELALKLAQLRAAGAAAGTAVAGLPGATPGATPGAPGSGTAIGQAILNAGGDAYSAAIAGREGTAPNPRSTAAGYGQFLASTWNNFAAANPDLFKGMSQDQILAARNDPAMAAKALTWLTQQNAGALTDAKVPVSGQSLGMSHYLGAGTVAKLWGANDNDPVSKYVTEGAVKANPELGTMTVGQLKARYAGMPDPAFLGTTTTAKGGPPPAPTTKATTPPAPTPSAVAAAVPGSGSPLATPPSAIPTTTPPAPPPAESPAVTTAKATAAKTGQATPIAGVPGMVAHPDGSVGPAPSAGMGGKKTTAAPVVPGGSATLGSATLPFTPYQVAGTDTGPPTSSLGLIGQAARAAEEGRPPPVAGAAPLGAVGGGGPMAQPTTTVPPAPAPVPAGQATPGPAPPVVAPTTAPAATPPGEVPPTYTYTRQALPQILQERIDHPENDPSIVGYDTSIRTMAQLLASGDTSVARQLQQAQTDRAAAIAKVKAEAIQVGEKWQQDQATLGQSSWKTAFDAQQAIRLKQIEAQQAIEQARVQSGLTIEQKGAEAGLADAQQQLTDMAKNSTEARTVGNQLRLMPSIIDQLPQPGFAAQLAKDHPALVPYMVRAGALSPEQADATQVMQGLIGYMSVGLRPTGSGALRNAEMDRFQQVLPSMMQSPQGRRDSQSLLQTLQDRIVAEHEFASKYFRRIDPATGKPAYNLDGLGDAMDAPKSQGGLGDIAPTGPQPVTTDANGQTRRMSPAEVQQWVHSNVGEGHAYWGWAPVGDGTYKPKLMVRRDNG